MVKNAGSVVAFQAQPALVKSMVERGIMQLSGKTDPISAWKTYASTQDTIGIKVYSAPGGYSGTRPAVVAAVVEGLLATGLDPQRIVIWDKHRSDLLLAGYTDLAQRYHVRLEGAAREGYDPNVFYDNPVSGDLVACGDYEFDLSEKKTGRKSYVSKLLTKEITRIIIIAPLLNHNYAGVCGNLYIASPWEVWTIHCASNPTLRDSPPPCPKSTPSRL